MQTPTRRAFLAAGGLSLAALAGCTGTDSGSETPGGVSLTGETVATGIEAPADVAVPRPGEYVVADQFGRLAYFEGSDTTPSAITDLTDSMAQPGGEKGLLGVALHPDDDGSGRIYVRYSAPPRSGMPDGYSHTFVLSEFRLSGGRLDRDSERVLLEIPQPQGNHNAGSVAFGPDGYLYVGVGDGGGGNDRGRGHVDDWYDAVPGGNGQDVEANLLGSVLRIDVDGTGDGRAYEIPADNPLVGRPGRDEQYAWGFRNPWRLSVGPAGRLFVADVGQSSYEEVNIVERGGNYGWNVREGAHCFRAEDCPTTGPDGDPLIDPIIEYPHRGDGISGVSVIGGYMYDGTALPALQGRYVFADYVADGRLFVATEGEEGWSTTTVPIDGIGPRVLSFGETPAGELLVCTTGGDGGAVHRIRAAGATTG